MAGTGTAVRRSVTCTEAARLPTLNTRRRSFIPMRFPTRAIVLRPGRTGRRATSLVDVGTARRCDVPSPFVIRRIRRTPSESLCAHGRSGSRWCRWVCRAYRLPADGRSPSMPTSSDAVRRDSCSSSTASKIGRMASPVSGGAGIGVRFRQSVAQFEHEAVAMIALPQVNEPYRAGGHCVCPCRPSTTRRCVNGRNRVS